MNYIKQLQKEVRAANSEIQILNEGLDDLVRYLNLPKFYCGSELDGYVHVNDVLRRIEQTRNNSDYARNI